MKSRKEDSERESKRSHRERDKDDREHIKERNGVDRHHHRSSTDKKSKDSSHHSLRDGSEDRHKRKEREGEREHKERSKNRVDDRVRDRDDREADGDKEDKERHKEKSKEKSKEKVREKEQEHEDKEHEKERDRERELKEKERKEKEKEKEKEREHEDRERERERERKEKAREKEREREERERERERERMEKAREKEREREDKERERERERKEREREKERHRREREKEEERAREKEVDRIREKEKRHATSRDYSSDDSDVKARDKKRRRHEDDYKVRDSEKGSKSNKHRDKNKDSDTLKAIEDETVGKKDTTREEDMAEEQKRLDEEMEKRRRRVQEWQELRRKKEDSEMETNGVASSAEDPKSGKAWTLEGESDDEESASGVGEDPSMDVDGIAMPTSLNGDAMPVDAETGPVLTMSHTEVDSTVGVEDIDPLDAFMNSMVLPEVEKLNNVSVPSHVDMMTTLKEKNGNIHEERTKKGPFKSIGRIISGEDSDSDYGDVDNEGDPLEDEDDEEFLKRVKKTKVEKLTIVDHSKIDYPPFRKNFHIEVKEIAKMTSEEVSAWRKQLELKIHGKDVPKPVKAWHQTGLSTKILDTIKKLNFERPMSIQAQAIPVIMSGRDCIGVAKTGSGKTLAFVLPMLRHIKDQPALMPGDGPIGLVMAPTRELVQQIHSDIKKFAKVVGLSCVPVYGGSGVAQQISDLKRGTEIVVCTPGRMIDILCTSSGKITNLRRVTYLVMDEADRMFDMGFEPQITRIVQNTRPDRQTVLFSATFPRQVETLARKVLNKPIEIQVGGRSVVNKDISQLVEVRPENERFLRLLELLGEWYEKGKILIFVHTQEKCDALFKEMLRHGYPCLSLHGAKDQTDRESTITDFKSNVCNLMIATSIAARGLDVKELELVINFDVPNHYEDYVHRVGRTGRAGRKGCAITFIAEEDARYAPDLVKALELSEQVVPDDLKALADGFLAKVNQGLEKAHGTGYGGSGFKFNEEEDEERRAAKKAQAKGYGFEEDKSDSDDEDDGVKKTNDITQPMSVPGSSVPAIESTNPLTTNGLPAGQVEAARAAALAALMNLKNNLLKIQAETMPEHYEAELEINEFPQNARWKVTHKETLGPISEWSGAAITTRGQYFPPGKIPGPGERKLYLFIEGPDEKSVKNARTELKRVLEDITAQTSSLPGSAQPGRYSVFS